MIEQLGNHQYENLVKAIISFEKGIEDRDVLDSVYDKFMDKDMMGLLHDRFDEIIDECMSSELEDEWEM